MRKLLTASLVGGAALAIAGCATVPATTVAANGNVCGTYGYVDVNNDGFITGDEWNTYRSSTYDFWDANRDGRISRMEFENCYRGGEVDAPLDPDAAAKLDAGHGPALARLADQRAVEQRQHVDRLLEANSGIPARDPVDRSDWTVAGRQLDRHFLARHLRACAPDGRAERRDFADRAGARLPGSIEDHGVQRSQRIGGGRVVRPRKLRFHDKGSD